MNRSKINNWPLVARSFPHYFLGDGSAAKPRILKFDITYRCKLRCKFCFYWGYESITNTASLLRTFNEMTFEEINTHITPIIRNNKIRFITISGGEPFIRPDLGKVIGIFSAAGAVVSVNTSTHGMSQSLLDALSKYRVGNIQVSLHGIGNTHDSIVRWPGAFHTVIANISLLRQALNANPFKPRLTCCFVVNPDNQSELLAAAQLASSVGIDEFFAHFIEWQDSTLCSQEIPRRASMTAVHQTHVDAKLIYAQLEKCRDIFRDSKMHFRTHPISPTSAEEIDRWHTDPTYNAAQKCIFLWMETRIDPYGNMLPCLYLSDPIGNIMTSQFDDIWRSKRLGSIRIEIQRKLRPVCYKCCKLSRPWQRHLIHLP